MSEKTLKEQLQEEVESHNATVAEINRLAEEKTKRLGRIEILQELIKQEDNKTSD